MSNIKCRCGICKGTGKHKNTICSLCAGNGEIYQYIIERALEEIHESIKAHRNGFNDDKKAYQYVESIVRDFKNRVNNGQNTELNEIFYEIDYLINGLVYQDQKNLDSIKSLRESLRVFSKEHGYDIFKGSPSSVKFDMNVSWSPQA